MPPPWTNYPIKMFFGFTRAPYKTYIPIKQGICRADRLGFYEF